MRCDLRDAIKYAAGKGERVRTAVTLPGADAQPDSCERPIVVVHCEDYHPSSYCHSLE